MAVEDLERLEADVSLVIALGLILGPLTFYKALDAKGGSLNSIPYQELNLDQPWERFETRHELTTKGIQKFVSDFTLGIATVHRLRVHAC